MIPDQSRARRLLACLGDPSRFRVIAKLAASEYCVTELAHEIGLSQSCTTRHLQALQREGIVSGIRSGKRVVFTLSVEEPMIAGLVGWVLSQPDPGRGERRTTASRVDGGTARGTPKPQAVWPLESPKITERADAGRAPDQEDVASTTPAPSASPPAPEVRSPQSSIEDFLL